MSSPIEESDASKWGDSQQVVLADAMTAARPLVLRGLCRDWPLVREARRSPSAFAQPLVALDAGTPVDVLHMPPDADGVVGNGRTGARYSTITSFADGDPAAHIPEGKRGVLGEVDPDAVAALRERIRSGL